MVPPSRFFNRLATLSAVLAPQDAAGGEVPTPAVVSILVPCCVQQDSGPSPTEGQGRGSEAAVRVFFRPVNPASTAAVLALKVWDQVAVLGLANPIVLDGTPFDASGRGVVYEATGVIRS